MLLSSLKSLQAQNDNNYPSTGEYLKADTTIAIIPIKLIKQANVKLIERKYLIKINNEQDSIIKLKDKYIIEQNSIIVNFQNRVHLVNDLNKSINETLNKEKKRNKIITYSAGGIIAGLVIGLIIK